MHKMLALFVSLATVSAASAQFAPTFPLSGAAPPPLIYEDFECPTNRSSYHPHPSFCDRYIQCKNSTALERQCPDGLVFVGEYNRERKTRCDFPFSIDCTGREKTQPPQKSRYCPRRNGLFAHPDAKVCDQFTYCSNGEFTFFTCTPGLLFDLTKGTCNWPAEAGRVGCLVKEEPKPAEEEVKYKCPEYKPSSVKDAPKNLYTLHADPEDCQAFFICIQDLPARQAKCTRGLIYNEETQQCDVQETSEKCKDYYTEEELEEIAEEQRKAAEEEEERRLARIAKKQLLAALAAGETEATTDVPDEVQISSLEAFAKEA